MRIDLVFFAGCPHVGMARARLREALERCGVSATWFEWDTAAATTPAPFQRFASPSVLIDGRDVEGKPQVAGAGCAASGGPGIEVLTDAIQASLLGVRHED